MPKTHPNDGLVFLYMCILNSDLTTIDWKALGEATNLKLGAARMRYHRLKKNMDVVIKDGKFDLSTTSASTPAKKQSLDMITATDKESSVEPNSPVVGTSAGVVSIAALLNKSPTKRKMADDDDSEAETIIDPSFRDLPVYPPYMHTGGPLAFKPTAKMVKKEE
ncbi:hypothetical protein BDQ94DRAFT_175178 [Aspergillus welwitschiae]|uniref:Myb-like DNA-binding domain-containing protein n=1 Tax=Aspergillus welwitschiae TaxID=1341132 RepID=A0A3F3PM00_9EURO|nr:hypothetical protein BDQ94DRAFT_175178 [Aspergillus welwitschiae]RDH27863.1 hypothetical protein BDQ94DRAFT_175178 [Aspergillus welwitschiae]